MDQQVARLIKAQARARAVEPATVRHLHHEDAARKKEFLGWCAAWLVWAIAWALIAAKCFL